MSTTIWKIWVNWDRNTSVDPFDNVADRALSAHWFLGMRHPYQTAGDDGMLTLVLDNVDRRYSPEYEGSPLYGKVAPFKPIYVQSVRDGVTRVMWHGWIERIEPAVGLHGERAVQITASGPMPFLRAAETRLPLQENLRADQILAALIGEVVFPPALSAAWILGRADNGKLNSSTYLANPATAYDFETGIATFAMAADNWVRYASEIANQDGDTYTVYQAISDVSAAERGRFYFDRDGKARFWNRHHTQDEVTADATYDDSMVGMDYTFADSDDLKNEIVVTCHPRTVSPTYDEVLWKLTSPVRVPRGETRTLTARYTDESGNRIGGRSVTITDVVYGVDSNSPQDGGTLRLMQGANSATLEVTAPQERDVILSGCTLRGQKITDFGQMDAQASDLFSVADYGRRTMKLNLRALDNLEDAQRLADYELSRRKAARGMVKALHLKSHGIMGGSAHDAQLMTTIGSRVIIKESQTYHGKTGTSAAQKASYLVIGEAHRLTQGATLLETTWYLEPTPETYPWKLGTVGRGELEINTGLAF
mgnify:CR=1 FL=1